MSINHVGKNQVHNLSPIILNSNERCVIMGKNQVLFLSQMEEIKMAKQVHIRVDDDIYKELSD